MPHIAPLLLLRGVATTQRIRLATQAGISLASLQRIWSELGLAPQRVDTFQGQHEPAFTEKLIDVVGLYLDPPEKAIVL